MNIITRVMLFASLFFINACSHLTRDSFIQQAGDIKIKIGPMKSKNITITSCKQPNPKPIISLASQHERRIALVIANSEYGEVDGGVAKVLKLESAKEDGKNLTYELAKSGFDVIYCQNIELKDMELVTDHFVNKVSSIQEPLTVVFHYSGHGTMILSADDKAEILNQKTISFNNDLSNFLGITGDKEDKLDKEVKKSFSKQSSFENDTFQKDNSDSFAKTLCEYKELSSDDKNKKSDKTSNYLIPSNICTTSCKSKTDSEKNIPCYSKESLFSVSEFLRKLSSGKTDVSKAEEKKILVANKKIFISIDACSSSPQDILDTANNKTRGGNEDTVFNVAPDSSGIDLNRMLVLYGATPGGLSGNNEEIGGVLTHYLLEGIKSGVSATDIVFEASKTATEANLTAKKTTNDSKLQGLGFPWIIGATGIFMNFYFRPIYQSTLPWN